jgi:sulfofructose kinase
MKKIVGLGANVLDTLINCKQFPTEDTKMRADGYLLVGGGPVGNAMVVASKLGMKTEMIGAFADDTAGERILSELRRFGVDTAHATVMEGASSFVSYIIISEKDSTRTCLFDRGTVADDPAALDLSPIDKDTILHLDGNYLQSALAAAKYAKSVGAKVSHDAGGLYEGIEALLPLVDILIPSAEFAMGITGAKTPEEALLLLHEKYAPEVLVVTDGKNGGYYFEDGEAKHYESFKIKALDTNGAGDTFHGAFVTAYANGMTVAECCRFASAVAAYKCLHIGARDYDLDIEKAKRLFSED